MKIVILDDHHAILLFIKEKVLEMMPSADIQLCSSIHEAKMAIEELLPVSFVICDLEINAGCSTVIPEFCNALNVPCMVYSSHIMCSPQNHIRIIIMINQHTMNLDARNVNKCRRELELKYILCYQIPFIIYLQKSDVSNGGRSIMHPNGRSHTAIIIDIPTNILTTPLAWTCG